MVFHHVKESYHQLVIIYGNNIIQIFFDIWENIFSRSLYRRAVGNGVYRGQCDDFSRLKGGLHAAGPGRLHPDDFNLGI